MIALVLWGHALAALLFGLLAVSQLRRGGRGPTHVALTAALALTALWALAVAGIDPRDVSARVAEGLRNLAWLAFMYGLATRDRGDARGAATATLYGAVALVLAIGIALAIVEALVTSPAATLALTQARIAMRLMAATGALLLVHQLHAMVAPSARGSIRLALLALAVTWGTDLLLFGSAWVVSPRWPLELVAMRGLAMAAIAPVFAVAIQRDGEWSLQLSRTATFQSLSIAAIAFYILVMVLAGGVIGELGGAHSRVIQTAFVFGTTAALITLVSTPWLRAWTKVIVAKHLFTHRYDYREEWLRFSTTLGGDGQPLAARVVTALANVTTSPGGALFVITDERLGTVAQHGWDDGPDDAGLALAVHLAATRRIVDLDAVRTDQAPADEAAAVPQWMLDHADAWAIVPLIHAERLIGAVLLARPPVDRRLDWEDFDLLAAAGRQAASYLAEDHAREALAEAARFDEFNRKFAFIMHDLKNLVSQLTLVARNAERHADNPEFRADMVATLRDSSDRMTALLARLAPASPLSATAVQPVALMPLAERVAAARRAQCAIACLGDRDALVSADPARLEQLLGHLIQNAIEASTPGQPVTLMVHTDGIEVIDEGCGMSAAFMRTRLFKPFDSSRDGGFGIGAYEARQLARSMGGEVTVTSREGEGSRFRVTLPPALTLEHAA